MTLTTPPPRFPVVPSNRRIHHMQRGQRGVTLFFALIALVSIMLAAVALVRSVDTSTIIAGNLAFQQAATRSTDTGAEAAMAWLKTQADSTTDNPTTTAAHPFNNDSPANGYYATWGTNSIDPASADWEAMWNAVPDTLVTANGSVKMPPISGE